MRIVCQQTILVKFHALFVISEKGAKLQTIGGTLWVNSYIYIYIYVYIYICEALLDYLTKKNEKKKFK